MKRSSVITAIIFFVFALAQASALTLKTQFKDEFDFAGPHAAPIVVIYADREGSNHTGDWLQAARAHDFAVIEAANLEAAPAIARPFVRNAMRDVSPVLLDWKGELAARYGFAPGVANVYVLDRFGNMLKSFSGVGAPHEIEAFESYLAELEGAGS